MRRLTGPLPIALGVIHTLVGLVEGDGRLAEIARGGVLQRQGRGCPSCAQVIR